VRAAHERGRDTEGTHGDERTQRAYPSLNLERAPAAPRMFELAKAEHCCCTDNQKSAPRGRTEYENGPHRQPTLEPSGCCRDKREFTAATCSGPQSSAVRRSRLMF